jgi:1-phosphofructokinase family hexose kinase
MACRLLTVTPNPSLDFLFAAPRLAWDDANRVPPPRRRPGGQGINVVRAGMALGLPGLAVAPLGGAVGRELAEALAAEGTPHVAVPVAGETRVFVGVRELETGRHLLLNPRGAEAVPGDPERLLDVVRTALRERGPAWVASCGSLPPGYPEDFHARVGNLARQAGARFVADSDGPGLAAAAAGCQLLVPNVHEAERLLQRKMDGPDAAVAAARALVARYGTPLVSVTLGQEGAVAATAAGAWHVAAPPAGAGSAVGAGDAFLAALVQALLRGDQAPEALRRGVAAGSAVLASEGAAILRRSAYEGALADTIVTAYPK